MGYDGQPTLPDDGHWHVVPNPKCGHFFGNETLQVFLQAIFQRFSFMLPGFIYSQAPGLSLVKAIRPDPLASS